MHKATAAARRFRLVRVATVATIAIAAIAGITVAARQPGTASGAMISTDRRVSVAGFDNETGDTSARAIGHLAADWWCKGWRRRSSST
jgi:hypothetical protein